MFIFKRHFWGAPFFLSVLVTCLLFMGCTHLFYQPTQGIHFPPEMIDAHPVPLLIPSPDGGLISAWRFEPPKGAKAHLLFFHGNAENLSSHYLTLIWILKHGYGFTIFDYRGYGQSTFSKGSDSVTPESTISDGVTMLKWFRRESSNVPLIVYAQSLGGAIALSSVAAAPADVRPQLLVADSTFESYQEAARGALSSSWVTWLFQWMAYPLVTDRVAPEKIMGNIAPVPLLVIHGTRDPVVDIRRGRRVFNLAKEPKEFWEIPSGLHGDLFWRHDGFYRKQFVNKLDALFVRHVSFQNSKVIYQLPFLPGQSRTVIQGYHGHFSHQNSTEYALDFGMPQGTPILAARAGKVVAVKDDSTQGGNDLGQINNANFIVIDHGDDTKAEYYHLQPHTVQVKVGDSVETGQRLASSGATGYVSTPHLHLMIYRTKTSISPPSAGSKEPKEKQSLPTLFATDSFTDITLEEGKSYFRSR